MERNSQNAAAWRMSIAPMMDCTDRHCRYFHRLITSHALLYTEMIHANAVVHGRTEQLLENDPFVHPVALQLGGSDPRMLYEAARIGAGHGYNEINLNSGCPSPRVQSGNFGAVLMTMPELAADCVRAMIEGAAGVEVTVKCRIAVDDQDPETVLPEYLDTLMSLGVRRVTIHARKALLKGLSPRQNRTVPPLDYGLVYRMKREYPNLRVCLNGGVDGIEQVLELLDAGLDGVMTGRKAYHDPMDILAPVDRLIFGDDRVVHEGGVLDAMLSYIDREVAMGVEPYRITRHMIGLFSGRRGARRWRGDLANRQLINDRGTRYIGRLYSSLSRDESIVA